MTAALDIDDATFVRAPVGLVYRRLTHVQAWPEWWPGLQVRGFPPDDGDQRWAVSLQTSRTRIVRVSLTAVRWRHEAGLRLRVAGDIEGRVEFWLDPGPAGTVVHHVASVSSALRFPRSALRGYQRAVRRGLWGFKDVLQLEVRTSAGVLP